MFKFRCVITSLTINQLESNNFCFHTHMGLILSCLCLGGISPSGVESLNLITTETSCKLLEKLTAHLLVTGMCRLFIKPFPDGSCRLLHSPVSAAAFTPGELNLSLLCSGCWGNVVWIWLLHTRQMVNHIQSITLTECFIARLKLIRNSVYYVICNFVPLKWFRNIKPLRMHPRNPVILFLSCQVAYFIFTACVQWLQQTAKQHIEFNGAVRPAFFYLWSAPAV